MAELFGVVFLIAIIGMIIGLIKPKLVLRWGEDGKKNRKRVVLYYGLAIFISIFMIGVTAESTEYEAEKSTEQIEVAAEEDNEETLNNDTQDLAESSKATVEEAVDADVEEVAVEVAVEVGEEGVVDDSVGKVADNNNEQLDPEPTSELENIFEGYTLIEVAGGDLCGCREPNVVVDIGFGDREYYAFTNQYGQLVSVIASEIILQDDNCEPVLSTGRYFCDEAKVPGTESPTLDEGHVIADSLGGVSNAYNITPEDSTLNRHGDQAYMEKVIRDAGGCEDFIATITYSNTTTQIPKHYSFTYTLMGNEIHDEFDNVNPDEINVVETQEDDVSPIEAMSNGILITKVDLSAEEVIIKNNSDVVFDMKNCVLLSTVGSQKYVFPACILNPGEIVTVYSGKGSGDLKWTGSYVWNNDGDPAELYDSEGNLLCGK